MSSRSRRLTLIYVLAALAIQPCAFAAPAPVDVAIDTDAARPLRPGLIGANSNFMARPYGFETPQVIELTRELQLNVLRYPAGGHANTWDWQAANYVSDEAMRQLQDAQMKAGFPRAKGKVEETRRMRAAVAKYHPNRAMSVEGFMAFCDRMSPRPEPLWVANLLTGSPEMSAAWVAHNKAQGYPNDRWELGNEHYLQNSHFKYPTATEYLRDAEAHTRAMKATDPSVRVGVTAAELHTLGSYQEGLSAKDSFGKQWNAGLAEGRFYDAVIVHDYFFAIEENMAGKVTEDEMFRYLMARPPLQFPALMDYYRSVFGPDVTLWITEWNLSPLRQLSGEGERRDLDPLLVVRSLAHCLYLADWLLTATDYPDNIELATLHVLATQLRRGLFHAELPEEANLDKPFVRTPPFHAIRMLASAWQGADAVCSPRLEGVENVPGALGYEGREFPALVVRAFMKGKDVRAIAVINKSARPRAISIQVDGRPVTGEFEQETLTAPHLIEGFGKPKSVEMNAWQPEVHLHTQRVRADEAIAPAHSLTALRSIR